MTSKHSKDAARIENARDAQPAVAELHLPPEISYTCQNSGVCCTTFDTIPVSHNCAEQLETISPAEQTALRSDVGAGNGPFTAAGMPGDPPRLARKHDGSCIFFDKDRLCAVHRIIGPHAKPQVCRDFPYRYVETSGGTYVGLSFMCPSVRNNIGSPVGEQGAQLRSHYAVAQSVLEAPARVALNRRIELTWDEYIDLENTFAELLAIPSIPLNQRLIACCALVSFVDAYYQEMNGSPVVGPGNRMPPAALAGFLSALRSTSYAELLRVSIRARKGPTYIKQMFLGMFTGFANTLHRKGGRARTVATVLAQYVRHAAGIGKVRLKPIAVSLSYRDLARAKLPCTGAAVELIERYVRHCIFRKDLVLSGNVSRRLRLLVLNVALIPWYATAEAVQHGRTEPIDEDFSEAVAHVEKLYGFHSRFYRFFEENATFDDIVEAFMLKPNYPYLLLGQT
ncbi:MAG: hypothetical protein ACR2IE_09440 [Candidatus Sumerlaeaceae bacterium]